MEVWAQTRGTRMLQTGAVVLGLGASFPAAGNEPWWPWLLGIGLLAMVSTIRFGWQRLTIDGAGLTLHRVPVRVHVPWSRIARLEVRRQRYGEGGTLRAAHPLIVQHDGRRIRSPVLSDLRRQNRRDERRQVRRTLAEHAEAHGIELAIDGPGPSDDPQAPDRPDPDDPDGDGPGPDR